MTRLYLLDTNILSYLARAESPAIRSRLEAMGPNEVAAVSSISEAELRYGLARTPLEHRHLIAIDILLEQLPVLPWSRSEAQAYGLLRARQEALGKTLESMDMLIAAHAIATGAILVTRDQAFQNVPGLIATENWAIDL